MLFNKQLINKFRSTANAQSLKLAIELFLDTGIKQIFTRGMVPDSGPLLIISNHPGLLDTLIVYSKADRKDLYFLALAEYKGFGEEVCKFLLPIYRKKKLSHIFYKFLSDDGGDSQDSFVIDSLGDQEVMLKNRASISKAAQLINQERAVLIFPSGTVGKVLTDNSWKVGVGFLIKQVTNPKTQVVFAHLQGPSKMDATVFLDPLIRNFISRTRKMTVNFSKSYLLSNLISKNMSPQEITVVLEKKYGEIFE